MQKNAFVIINPKAGGFKRESVLGAIRRHFNDSGIAYEIHDAAREETLESAVGERLTREGALTHPNCY